MVQANTQAKPETPEQKLARLEAENAKLRAEANARKGTGFGQIRFKVSAHREPGTNGKDDKGTKGGGVSIYGLQRFPITLYKEQLIRLFAVIPELQAFVVENDAKLSVKSAK